MLSRKTAFCGLVLALALIAGYVESLIPVAIAIPGIKLGAANSVILILLYMVGVRESFILCHLSSGKRRKNNHF